MEDEDENEDGVEDGVDCHRGRYRTENGFRHETRMESAENHVIALRFYMTALRSYNPHSLG